MTSHTSTTRLALTSAAFLALLGSPLAAQEAALVPRSSAVVESASPAAAAAVAAPSSGPTLESASVAVRQPASSTKETTATAPAQRGLGKSAALMVVGGAAVLTGLIVGGGAGYAIAVGGAVVGLYGLYQYLQ